MRKFWLYFHTLRHLRPKQIWYQFWRRAHRPKIPTAPRAELDLQGANGQWSMPARRMATLLGSDRMRFIGTEHTLPEVGWSGGSPSLLWRYNQHYFDDLNADRAGARRAWHETLIADWIAQNPPGSHPAFDPYPTSLRLVNWCKWLLAGGAPVEGMLESIAVQASYLSRTLEYHVMGNHLLANGKALVFAGTLFQGAEAAKWQALGEGILASELTEQVLADGGNFERSPMYHAICFEDVLDIVNLRRSFPDRFSRLDSAWLGNLAAGMRFWLKSMCHADGEISQFNDAAVGIAPSPEELFRYADDLDIPASAASGVNFPGEGVCWLRDSGYVRVERDEAVLITDVAEVGPDYLPAHAHADTLSFELSIKGKRVVVNGGTSRYGTGEIREAERGTAAHSTVTVEGRNSSEVWAGFRVARRAYPFDLAVIADADSVSITAAHDGYRRLPGSPVHRRGWRLSGRYLEVFDEVVPAREGMARFLIAPGGDVQQVDENTVLIGDAKIVVMNGDAALAPAFQSREFGRRQSTKALDIALRQGHSRAAISW